MQRFACCSECNFAIESVNTAVKASWSWLLQLVNFCENYEAIWQVPPFPEDALYLLKDGEPGLLLTHYLRVCSWSDLNRSVLQIRFYDALKISLRRRKRKC